MSVCEGVIMHNFITKSPGSKYVHWRKLPVNLLEQPERLTAGTSENEEIVCPIRMHKNQLVVNIYGDLCCIEVARACLSSTAARPTSISGYSGFSTHRQLGFWELRFIMKKSPHAAKPNWLTQSVHCSFWGSQSRTAKLLGTGDWFWRSYTLGGLTWILKNFISIV